MLPNFVATPTRNNQKDVFQRLCQSLRISDCLLQTSISFPTHSTECSLRGWIHDEGGFSGRATGYPFASESSRLFLDSVMCVVVPVGCNRRFEKLRSSIPCRKWMRDPTTVAVPSRRCPNPTWVVFF